MRNLSKGLFFVGVLLLATLPAMAGDHPEDNHPAAVSSDTSRSRSLVQAGRASLAHGDYDAALKSLMEAYSLDPQNHETIHSIMAVHVRKGNYTEAVGFLEQAANALDPAERKEIHEIIALVYFKKALKDDKNGKESEAEVSLRKAVSLDPESVNYLIALARMRHKSGSFDEAETLLSQGLEQFLDEASRSEIRAALEKMRLNEAILRKIR